MKGKISISRFTSNTEPRSGVTIRLTDESSGCGMVEITMSPEEFGNSVTGLGYTDCEYKLGNVEKSGKVLETKSETIKISSWKISEYKIESILAPYETDGWTGRRADFNNHHNRKGDNVRVSFHRYVDPN